MFPENMATFNIVNTSLLKADINISFQKDNTGKTFLLDPVNPFLKPGEGHLAIEPGESKVSVYECVVYQGRCRQPK